MCGRFTSTQSAQKLAEFFEAETLAVDDLTANHNVAPTQSVPVIVDNREHERAVTAFRWGLVPSWAKDPSVGSKMINARAETVAEKNAYKRSLKSRRCIVPASGFYEWKVLPGQKTKQPMYISRADGDPLAFAGLWETWRPKRADGSYDDDESPLRSCTIITTSANQFMAAIHDRMPVILPRSSWDRWLDPTFDDVEQLQALLVPADEGLLVAHPVSTMVNNVRNNTPDLIVAIDPDAPPITAAGSTDDPSANITADE